MKKFFWIDMEMTGLDEKKDSILEVAAVVTDVDFNVLETYDTVVFQTPEVVNGMNDWCKEHHGKSGLTARIPSGKKLDVVEKEIVTFLDKHFPTKDKVPLCGNSVGNDKRFIDEYMKKFSSRLHYRIIDVSSFKEIFREKYKVNIEKESKHRALDDIFESIKELKTYLSYVKIDKNGG
ncbi:oligoribonuclease [bacterium]|nr:oligoribonuclease [bacterium]